MGALGDNLATAYAWNGTHHSCMRAMLNWRWWDEVDMNSEWIEKWIEAVAVSTAPCGLPINGVNVTHVAEQREANGRYVCGIPL